MSKYHTWYQLMDQSVTATFKPDCLSTIKQAICVACKKYALNLTIYWKGYSIWSAVNNIKDSWDEIKVSATSDCWKMSFSDLVGPTQYSNWRPRFHKKKKQSDKGFTNPTSALEMQLPNLWLLKTKLKGEKDAVMITKPGRLMTGNT
jgi:hypothetical protein